MIRKSSKSFQPHIEALEPRAMFAGTAGLASPALGGSALAGAADYGIAATANECVEDPATPGFDCSVGAPLPGAQLSARLDFSTLQSGRDVITSVNGVSGLVLLSRPEASPSDQGLNSKTVTVYVKDWVSNTSTPVELLIRDGSGRGRILNDFQIPNNLPNRMRVFPAEGTVRDALIRQDPGNMYTAGVSDKKEYGFNVSFSVLRGATAGTTPITLIVRQGQQERVLRLDLVVVTEMGRPVTQGPTGTVNTVTPTFQWAPVQGASRYEVWVQDTRGTRVLHNPAATATSTSIQSWTATSFLTRGQQYFWWVRAIATDGTPGPWSVTQTFTVAANAGQTAPQTPAISWQPVSNTNIRLNWTNVASENGYVVQYWNATSKQWVSLRNVGADVTSFEVSSAYGFYYRVGAFNSVATSFSSYIYVAPQAQTTPPAAPTNLAWSLSSGSNITLSWSNVAAETGYRVEYWNGTTWVALANVGADVTQLPITSGYGYYFRVGATNASGKYNFSNYILAR